MWLKCFGKFSKAFLWKTRRSFWSKMRIYLGLCCTFNVANIGINYLCIIPSGLWQVVLVDHCLDSDILNPCFAYKGEFCCSIYVLVFNTNKFFFMEWTPLTYNYMSDVLFGRAGGSASEEALDRLPTSATCMNLLKLPPYKRFVLALIAMWKWIFLCFSLGLNIRSLTFFLWS